MSLFDSSSKKRFASTSPQQMVPWYFTESRQGAINDGVRHGILDGPPSPETVDEVLEAFSNISGKTYGSIL